MEFHGVLFLVPFFSQFYTNDSPLSSSKLAFYLFADDTNIYCESESLNQLQSAVNRESKKVKMWLEVNKLSLNIDKTSCMNLKVPSTFFAWNCQHQNWKVSNLRELVMYNFLVIFWMKIFHGSNTLLNYPKTWLEHVVCFSK